MKWLVYESIFVNDGQGIKPPSLNVATFDGYNANGVPYSTNPLETGIGDVLESQPIKLEEVNKEVGDDYLDKIWLSFFYQAGGNSEMPNPSDYLLLEFKNNENKWKEIHRFRVKANVDPSQFYDTAIHITGEYLHNAFQFRFSSFGRLSGAYDAWHVDYVYVNRRVNDNEEIVNSKGEPRPDSVTTMINENDKSTNISDRTSTKPFTSIFRNGYFSIPKKHFRPEDDLVIPTVFMYSLKEADFSPLGEDVAQVVDYTSHFKITNYTGTVPSISYDAYLDEDEDFDPFGFIGIELLKDTSAQIKRLPADSYFDSDADSTTVRARISVDGGDNNPNFDYYKRYEPIEFRSNDTTEITFVLSNYYAYDDGVAEYTAGLAAQGNQLAYRFVMDPAVGQDTLNGVHIYFPFTAGTVPENIQLYVFADDGGKPATDFTFSQTVPLIRTSNNLFTTIPFGQGIVVQDTFYIGYLETQSGDSDRIRIGLDASHDTGEQMYSRITVFHPWVQNDELKGSLMIRPRFGKAIVITGVDEDQNPVSIYPNPTPGEFYMKGPLQDVQIISITGQPMSFRQEEAGDVNKIVLQGAAPGMYIVRYRSGSRVFSDKIIVTGN